MESGKHPPKGVDRPGHKEPRQMASGTDDPANLEQKKLFLLDMDGTIYLGNHLFDYSLAFFRHLDGIGARYLFLTNNSSKSADQYIQKLLSMNIPADPEHLITSTYATAHYLNSNYGGQTIFVSGTTAFVRELEALGIHITQDPDAQAAALVMGFDTELTFQKLEHLCILLGKGLDYIATNPDLVCPTEYGYVPDCGSVAQILKNATGREPLFIGKPMPAMVDMALERAHVSKEEAVIIGDRLYTDIACGIAAGIDTVLVLSGESTEQDLHASQYQPDYVFRDLGELLAIWGGQHG